MHEKLSYQFSLKINRYISIANEPHIFVTPQLLRMINTELRTVMQSLFLTPTQAEIIEQLPNHHTFYADIVGNLFDGASTAFNLYTGRGLQPTGLCKIYFDALTIAAHVYFLQPNCEAKLLFHHYGNRSRLRSATLETLAAEKEIRVKRIILLICQTITKFANTEQLKQLATELSTNDNHPVNKLCAPRNIMRFFKTCENTFSYNKYETVLLKQVEMPRLMALLVGMLIGKPHADILNLISLELKFTDFIHLSCLNHDFVRIGTDIEAARQRFGKKFSSLIF